MAVPSQREAGVVKSYAGDREKPSEDQEKAAARRKALAAMIQLEENRFIEEVPET